MHALQYLQFLIRSTNEFPGFREVSCQPSFKTSRCVGAFGHTLSVQHTQKVMIDGTWFIVTVERDPNQ